MALIMMSIFGSFLNLGGLKGIAVLDVCNLFIIVTIIFSGVERIVFFSIYLSLFCLLVYIQIFHPNFIQDTRFYDAVWFDTVEIFTRCATAFNVGFALKTEYDKEHNKVLYFNNELKSVNEEITQQQRKIMLINENLENLVQERTQRINLLNEKIIKYAFFNAHNVRGHLARIMGLVNITNYDR